MTILFYTPLKGASNGRFGAMWAKIVRSNFFQILRIKRFHSIFQVTRHFTSSYHPQTNSERMNSTIAQCLLNLHQPRTNKLALPGVMMAIRMSPSTQSSNLSHHHLVFGKEMNFPFDASLVPREGLNRDAKAHVSDLMAHLKIVKNIAKVNIKKAQEKQKYDKKTKKPTKPPCGTICTVTLNKSANWSLPKTLQSMGWPILHNCNWTKQHLQATQMLSHKELKSYIYANRLKPYDKPDHRPSLNPPPQDEPRNDQHVPPQERPEQMEPNNLHQQQQTMSHAQQTPLQILLTPENEQQPQANENDAHTDNPNKQYYVEKLLRYKFRDGKKFFHVKWMGHSERTLEPEKNLPQILVKEFHITKTQ